MNPAEYDDEYEEGRLEAAVAFATNRMRPFFEDKVELIRSGIRDNIREGRKALHSLLWTLIGARHDAVRAMLATRLVLPTNYQVDFAIQLGYRDMVEVLLPYLAGPLPTNFMDDAVDGNKADIVHVLLRDRRFNVMSTSPWLAKAANMGNVEIFRMFLEDGRIHLTENVLPGLVVHNLPDMLRVVLQDPRLHLDPHSMLLALAVESRLPQVIQLLLDDGRIDPTTALGHAHMHGYRDVWDFMMQHPRLQAFRAPEGQPLELEGPGRQYITNPLVECGHGGNNWSKGEHCWECPITWHCLPTGPDQVVRTPTGSCYTRDALEDSLNKNGGRDPLTNERLEDNWEWRLAWGI